MERLLHHKLVGGESERDLQTALKMKIISNDGAGRDYLSSSSSTVKIFSHNFSRAYVFLLSSLTSVRDWFYN